MPRQFGPPLVRRVLTEYDSSYEGPLFAVSDEGSAASTVVDAAYASAKAKALGSPTPDQLGVILDGERMTSAGEMPIGPPEYAGLSATADRLLLTTNVGTRVNVRLTAQLPEFRADEALASAVVAAFRPFVETPDRRPRPLTVRLRIEPGEDFKSLAPHDRRLNEARSQGSIGPADVHRVSVLVVFDDEITNDVQLAQIESVTRAAAGLGIKEVAIDADPLQAARQRWGAQGLLNVLNVPHLNQLLKSADASGVRLSPRYQVDVESAARTIWTGLEAARLNGFDAGKYGLLPLTLDEQAQVIEQVTRWTAGWTAIPAFYVDTPLVTSTGVFGVDQCAEAARRWLRAARGAGATVVLFDAPDRVTPRKLVKAADSPDGVLTVEQIRDLVEYGRLLGVEILWSGGITAPQAFELARACVHGIFSTSSTAVKMAVTAQFDHDPRLAAENEPTGFGVRRMHAIIQGGFLSARLGDAAMEQVTRTLVEEASDAGKSETALLALDRLLIDGWQQLQNVPASAPTAPVATVSRPVPADAVRVFRGRKHPTTQRAAFVHRLGQLFMPMTVQMQRLYGLTAYLPAVLPETKVANLPDEVALVFYRTQECYHHARRCVGGRAYSELHELAFDMKNSRTGFPVLFNGQVSVDQPYHVFERSVDWQEGGTRLYIGTRKAGIEADVFRSTVADAAKAIQQGHGPLNAAIFCVTDDSIIWWDHSPGTSPAVVNFFNSVADKAYAAVPRRVRVPTDLTEPYAGLSLNADEDFVNLWFPRS